MMGVLGVLRIWVFSHRPPPPVVSVTHARLSARLLLAQSCVLVTLRQQNGGHRQTPHHRSIKPPPPFSQNTAAATRGTATTTRQQQRPRHIEIHTPNYMRRCGTGFDVEGELHRRAELGEGGVLHSTARCGVENLEITKLCVTLRPRDRPPRLTLATMPAPSATAKKKQQRTADREGTKRK